MTIGAVASSKAAAAAGTSAVRFDAVGDKYSRSASGLNASTSMTWACWVKLVVDRNAFGAIICTADAGSNYCFLNVGGTGTLLCREATTGSSNAAYDLVVGTWTYVANVFDISGQDYIYYCAAPGTTLTQAPVGNSTGMLDGNTFYIANDGTGSWINASIAAVKIWTAALTKTELEAELPKYAAQRTSGLWASYEFRNGPQTTDDSGLGKTLTAAGTLTTDSSGPPIT